MKLIITLASTLACILFNSSCNDPAPGTYYSAVTCERCLAERTVNTATGETYVFPDSISQFFSRNSDSLVIRREDSLLVKWDNPKFVRYIGDESNGNGIWQTQIGVKIWTLRIAAENYKVNENKYNTLSVLVGNVIEGEYNSKKDTIQTRYFRNR